MVLSYEKNTILLMRQILFYTIVANFDSYCTDSERMLIFSPERFHFISNIDSRCDIEYFGKSMTAKFSRCYIEPYAVAATILHCDSKNIYFFYSIIILSHLLSQQNS